MNVRERESMTVNFLVDRNYTELKREQNPKSSKEVMAYHPEPQIITFPNPESTYSKYKVKPQHSRALSQSPNIILNTVILSPHFCFQWHAMSPFGLRLPATFSWKSRLPHTPVVKAIRNSDQEHQCKVLLDDANCNKKHEEWLDEF